MGPNILFCIEQYRGMQGHPPPPPPPPPPPQQAGQPVSVMSVRQPVKFNKCLKLLLLYFIVYIQPQRK